MIERSILTEGGYVPLTSEALPTNSSAAFVFPNPPEGTKWALLTVHSGTLTVTFDDLETPIAGSVGHPYPSVAPYEFLFSKARLKQIKGIGGATGYITYFGTP